MNCPNCGVANPDGGKFCMSCGQTLPAVTTSIDSDTPTSVSPVRMTATPIQPRVSTPPVNSAAGTQSIRVVVTDVNMRFGSMVVFMIKWVVAAIPAAIILALALALISAIFGGILGGILSALY